MNNRLTLFSALLIGASACTHKVDVKDININKTITSPASPSVDERRTVAAETCEAQYQYDKQNYLSAIERVIADTAYYPDITSVELDRFRAEINAAYNAVVMRCKTHMHCLEVQRYDEAKCYISASDRKDAERRFSDIAERLREIETDSRVRLAKSKRKKPGVSVNVKTSVSQSNDQSQTVDTQVGDDIEDQDVLVLCGRADNLLDQRCRRPCSTGRC